MAFAEFVALLGLLGLGGMGVRALWVWAAVLKQRSSAKIEREQRMADDLKSALTARDHQKLSDWLIVYGDCIDPLVKQLVEHRRDELWVDDNG